MAQTAKPPVWFWIVAILLVLWNAIGCYFCVEQFRLGAASAMWEQTPYHQALYNSLPGWYNYVYAVGTFGGLLGGLPCCCANAAPSSCSGSR
jgi:ABC-type long-subunit fatty acid transport system fused permease/ATPase subunit